MKSKRIIWKGKKIEGMSRKTKKQLLFRLEGLLVLNDLARKRMGEEGLRNLHPERVERIKRIYADDIKKYIPLIQRLPAEILTQIDDIEMFCFGYFNNDIYTVIEAYLRDNTK